jgi:4-aminobutyrate aminotransferase-like enzyme
MDQFFSDTNTKSALSNLVNRFMHYQSRITHTCPPQQSEQVTYAHYLEMLQARRGSALFYPYLGTGMGRGALVELMDGSIKYDMIAGIGAHFCHGHPDIVAASLKAALSNIVMQGNLQQNVETVTLLNRLCEVSAMTSGFLTTSGVMAVENALKICFQYAYPRQRVIAFSRCFAGRTLAVAQVTDKPQYRQGLPTTLDVDYIPFYNASKPDTSTAQTVSHLKRLLTRYPNQHGAFIVECIQGEGGYYAGTSEFFESVFSVAKSHDIPIIVDEIQTFGRTSHFFAYQALGLDAHVDVVTVGKLSQVCATLFQQKMCPKPGLISQTFTGSTSAIHVALVILDLLESNCLGETGHISQIRHRFLTHFDCLEKQFGPLFTGPYGYGGMIAFTPFKGDRTLVMQFLHRLFDAGVIGFVCGNAPTRVRFLPPIGGMTVSDVDAVMAIVRDVMQEVSQTA